VGRALGVAAAVLLATVPPIGAAAAEWGPWGQAPAAAADDRGEPGLAGTVLLGVISFYQQRMPLLVASHCRMEPSCSRYGREAIATQGPVLGAVLTFDRLLHEANEGSVSPSVMTADGVHVIDPVVNNLPGGRPR
jgi:hypothetical protein